MIPIRSAVVTGASGFIGSALCERLAEEGIRAYAVVRDGRAERLKNLHRCGTEIVELPTLDNAGLKKLFASASPDAVFHLAAYGVNPAHRDPDATIDGNLGFLARLLAAAREANVGRFIHTGSCHEYGAAPIEETAPRLLRETDPVAPLSTYGAAKAGSVFYGSAFAAAHDVPFVTLRLFGVFGPEESPHRLIPYVIGRLLRDEAVDLTSGEQVRDLLYIDDVTEAYLIAARSPMLLPRGVYNVCSGAPERIRDVVETIADVVGKPRSLLAFGRRQSRRDEAHWIVGDPARFMGATGWQPRISLREGIASVATAIVRRAPTASSSEQRAA